MAELFIRTANGWAERWCEWAMASLVGTSVVLGIVGVVWLVIRRRATPQLGYCLFLLVPLKLLVPLEIRVPEGMSRWLPEKRLEEAVGGGLLPAIDKADRPNVGFVHEPSVNVRAQEVAAASTSLAPDKAAVPAADSDGSGGPRSVMREDRSPALSAKAAGMLAWLGIVGTLIVRLVVEQRRLRARLRNGAPLAETLNRQVMELCERIGLGPIRALTIAGLSSPAVCGVFRPVLLLPPGAMESLSAGQRDWVLLHELAHIRRRDLLLSAIQRAVTVVQFWNPAVWIANRMIDRLREYCCDDVASVLSSSSAAEAGEAFLGMIRLAAAKPAGVRLNGAMGVFGSEEKAACLARLTRLLDVDRRLSARLGMASLVVVLGLGALVLPQIRAEVDEKVAEKDEKRSSEAATAEAAVPLRFELTVVDSDGTPVPQAQVEVRPQPMSLLTGCKVNRGELVRESTYGPFMKASDEGVLAIEFAPGDLTFLAFDITTDGYAPFFAQWSPSQNSESIPPAYTARLDRGQSVAGVVVNEDGQPVVGAHVHPSIAFKKREGDLNALHVGGSVKTDAEGKWAYHSVPASSQELSLEITHPDYSPLHSRISTSDHRLDNGVANPMVLSRGLTVTGRVTDQSGAPIGGAVIRTRFLNDQREAQTDADGTYRLIGCRPERTSLVVTAKGFGPELKSVSIEPGLSPVDFVLPPGKTIRVRVNDEQGRPLSGSRIFFQSWRSDDLGRGLGMVLVYTDEDGLWEWTDAPADEIIADIYPADGMEIPEQKLIARDEEYVFTRIPELQVTGRVVDRETQEPLKSFRVITGRRMSSGMHWDRRDGFAAAEGQFRLSLSNASESIYAVRIEAEGYAPATSRNIENGEGAISLDFLMDKGRETVLAIRTPEGQRAVDADVAIAIAGSQVTIRNGQFRDGSTYCDRRKADAEGRLTIPIQTEPFEVFVIHPAGYAHVKLQPGSSLKSIDLDAWSRVEGILHFGTDVAANAPLALLPDGTQHGDDVPSLSFDWKTQTDEEGKFVFERVIPGNAAIVRRVDFNVMPTSNGTAYSSLGRFEFAKGRTTQLKLGGIGRPVIGKLARPEGTTGDVDWNFSLVTLALDVPNLPTLPYPPDIENDPVRRVEWYQSWIRTPVGAKWQRVHESILRRSQVYYYSAVDRDGSFRFEDVPVETYRLGARLESVPKMKFARGEVIGSIEHHFTMPEIPGGRSDTPLDLGSLTLQKSE